MKGRSLVHGAGTIVNAMGTGLGAAFGIGLWTKAKVELTEDPDKLEILILNAPEEETALVKHCFHVVLHRFRLQNRLGARIETESNIPIASGLKSSSAAANAVTLAALGALGKKNLRQLEIVRLGVTAALRAGVTITGAFDDACASYFGGIVATDNARMRIVKKLSFEQQYSVLIHVPPTKSYSKDVNLARIRLLSPQVRLAFKEATRGRYWNAMILNGLLHSSIFGYDPSVALDALSAGAISAGLSGKGPSVVAVTLKENLDKIREAWDAYEGRIIETVTNEKVAEAVVLSA